MEVNRQILNQLILRSVNLRDIGLYHGKMGVTLALYLYAHKEGLKYVNEFAWDLLQEVYAGLNETLPVGIEYGLSGIGYGISLLKNYGIFNCDLDNVLYDIDQKIMAYDPRRISDFSYRTGAWGLYNYICLRMDIEGKINSFDLQYLQELQQVLAVVPTSSNGKPYKILWEDLQAPDWDSSEVYCKPIGIDGGLAYFLINNLD